ncbi:MAG: hypothetical protein NTZ27_06050 [Ignavibacteriales bacterium]|nr:hypothetical protein [Ignavibacteriales bacterium]
MQRLLISCLVGLLILSSCKLKDSVTSPQPGTGDTNIKVISPNGGETLAEGSSYQIQWTGTGTLLVRVQYSIDNGTSWSLIKDSLKNTGIYTWFPIPNTVSNQCRVRVSSLDGVSSAQSNLVFAIVKNSNKSLKITSPIGGETWQAGSSKQITWYSSGIDSVKIEYTIDNGQNWIVLSNSSKNTGVYFWQPIPNTPTTLAKVRIRDAQDGVTATESPNPFQILPQQTIKVVSPNGGEEWYAGSSNNIKWQSTNIENVTIEYTINGGATWTTIVSSTPSTGVYSWNGIPNVSSLQCKIRISNATNGTPSAVSDNNFTITSPGSQLITVTSPNGGEKWAAGSTQNITWASSGITNVKIEYTITNGISWNTITLSTPSTGFYTWTQLPNTPSTNCKIRISDALDGTPSDDSDNLFSITPAPSIVVTSPNGGEVWTSGSNQTIKYTSQSVPNVKIEYTTDGGANWTTITNSTPPDGAYPWNNIPNLTSYQCKVRVSDAMYGSPSDISDNNFTIISPGSQLITVTSPNGGEKWSVGSMQNITWNSSGITNVKIEYTITNGLSWNPITLSTPSSIGFYTWDPIPNAISPNCKIRISDALDGTPSDDSDNLFSITQAPSILVTSPNGGEVWASGSNQTIKYTSVNVSNVKIEYTTDGGASWITLTNSTTPTIGAYAWNNIPDLTSYQCKVRVSDAMYGSPSDVSDNNFTITNQVIKSITLTSPVGGEVWEANTSKTITWAADGVTNVKIEYTTNNGLMWSTIQNSISNTGSYNWAVPSTQSTQCKVKVSDVSGNPSSESPSTFTIKPAASITLISPNGNEVIRAGEAYNITWTAVGIDNVKIEYTMNNGVTINDWFTIVSSTPAAVGSYSFAFPKPSTEYKVRISEAITGSPSVTSAGTFTVLPKTSITVAFPNGGESWILGEKYQIQWTSVNVAKVKIEYTLNEGMGWTAIGQNLDNTGFYDWVVPTDLTLPTTTGGFIGSELCKIRVSEYDAANPTVAGAFGESANVFSIYKKFIRVVTPNGGEQWPISTPKRIEWLSKGVNNVNIDYTLDNGQTWTNIISNVQSTGAYDWTTPATVSSLGKIRITDASDATVTDESDGFFSLINAAK